MGGHRLQSQLYPHPPLCVVREGSIHKEQDQFGADHVARALASVLSEYKEWKPNAQGFLFTTRNGRPPSEDTAQTWQDSLRIGDGTRGARNDIRNRGIVHSAGRRHEPFVGEIPLHQVQALDANGTCALVVRALVGIGNLRPLVRTAFVSKMNFERRLQNNTRSIEAMRSKCP